MKKQILAFCCIPNTHEMNTCDSVIIKSPDTDVFILCTAVQRMLGSENLFFMTGTGKKSRTLHINPVCNVLGEELCRCSPGFHAFSGKNNCNTSKMK